MFAEDKFYKELENSLNGEKKNYASEAKDVSGLSVWEYNNPSAEEKWHLIEGYAVRLKRDNPTVRNSQIWKETQAWIKDNVTRREEISEDELECQRTSIKYPKVIT